MRIGQNGFQTLEQLQDRYLSNQNVSRQEQLTGLSFRDILAQKSQPEGTKTTDVKFSKHAMGRLEDRNIELTTEQVERLNLGTAKAGAKGINESLVIVDSLAFIVNVPNNTVITAMDQTEADENVFTNIDGAVII